MTRYLYIALFALGLTACGTTSQAPLDDAYYWPDKRTQSTPITQTTPDTPSTPETPAPAMEILSQQDTTITVRIKR